MSEEKNLVFLNVLKDLKHHIVSIIFTTIIFGVAAFVISVFLLTPKYEVETSVIVGNSENQIKSDIDFNQIQANKALVSTYSEIVKSRGIAEYVINELDLKINYEDFKDMITISPVNETQIISIKVKDTIPQRAVDIANTTSSIFKESVEKIMDLDNVQILDKAVLPDEIKSPNIPFNVIISSLIGLILSVIIALIKELSDTRIKTADDITESFDIPVLGLVPDSKKTRRK